MAHQQEGGWPLGVVQGVNHARVGNGPDFSGSISFNTLLTASPTASSASSSDLDTQSTGSFFHDKSITLGSLIGVSSSILELSRRSFRGRQGTESIGNTKGYNRPRTWFFSLCSKNSVDAISPSSLGHFLAVERKANSGSGAHMFIDAHPVREENSLFVDGHVAPPPHSSPWFGSDSATLDHRNPVLFSCICGHPAC